MDRVRVMYLHGAEELYGDGLAYATAGSVGLDLRACIGEAECCIAPGQRAAVPTGIAIEPLREGVAGFVYSRSGLGAVKGLTVAQGVGVIDPDYRGEITVFLRNTSLETLTVTRGERIAQLVFQPYVRLQVEKAGELSSTSRGAGGFGHTGSN